MRNPFELVTASRLTAQEAKDLWCDDTRLDRVKGKENCFINGHRGTGKSMLFRVLQYDCQRLLQPASEPDFLAVYLPVRDTEFLAEELELFQDDSQKSLISESHFCLLLVIDLFVLLTEYPEAVPPESREELISFSVDTYKRAFRFAAEDSQDIRCDTYESFLDSFTSALRDQKQQIVQYMGTRLYQSRSFNGPLFLFESLLGPLADFLQKRARKILYVLVDDGDDLPQSHTVVLNSWIARRRASVVFKVSTMFGYKTYDTKSGSAIQHPHDFFQFDIATRFLISDGPEDYVDLLRRICEKRLQLEDVQTRPGTNPAYEFFPEDSVQTEKLQDIKEHLLEEYAERYEGRTAQDYVYRHATSEYLKRLTAKKATHSFTYSGFETVAILSSGMVRDFIICAQRMFDNASRHVDEVHEIPPSIQSRVVRDYADEVLDDIKDHKQKRARGATQEDWRKVHNLIHGLGSLFKQKMLSDDSERRVFSFAFQDDPGMELEQLLRWAIEEGYLMKGFISRKEGTGRRVLYVLTRRIAPAFYLDVSSYAGYLSLRSETVRALMEHGPLLDVVRAGEQLTFFEPISHMRDDTANNAESWFPAPSEEVGF